ncbi:MAG: hypothetical protein DIU56_007115 [Pseudomonadota bacterium]|jgi:hypothetical protein|nr:MAG: hypothetical protein DIU56_10095 [Pseudomonadota bacterium]
MTRIRERAAYIASAALWIAALTGCGATSSFRWPWAERPEPPPAAVIELSITGEDGGARTGFPQYWKRNTLLIDLQSASGEGSIVLKPRPGGSWPARLAFRVMPGRVGRLELLGEERVVLPIAPEGGSPVDLELRPGLYRPSTEHVVVRWVNESGCCVSPHP